MRAKLVRIEPETEDITSFVFEPEKPITWKAGQFLRYVLPHKNMDDRRDDRFFTISSAPCEGYIRITTRFAPSPSTFKRALRELPVGGDIQIDEPEGEFNVNDPASNYLFVAGGVGITPVRTILAEADHNNQKLKARVLYGNHDELILFKDELDSFALRNPPLHIEYVTDSKGITDERVKQAIKSLKDPHVYLSGPEPMVEGLAVTVKKLGLDIGHIQTDFFPGYDTDS